MKRLYEVTYKEHEKKKIAYILGTSFSHVERLALNNLGKDFQLINIKVLAQDSKFSDNRLIIK